jgi:hypothetical protein
MRQRYVWNLDQLRLKCGSYWQSLLRFGLPSTILYFVIDYVAFRVATDDVGPTFPWRRVVISDIAFLLIVSTLWWALMRQLTAWKRKNEPDAAPDAPFRSRAGGPGFRV